MLSQRRLLCDLGSFARFDFQAEFDGFADAGHEFVEGMGLGVAAGEAGDGGEVEAFFVLLDFDVELRVRRVPHFFK